MTIRAQLSDIRSDATTNLALWLDRFPREHKQKAVRTHHENAVSQIGVPAGYKEAFRRREVGLLDYGGGFEQGQTRVFRAKLDGRAIVGIGEATVRETGCTLLRPWGVPCIPGSALKGLAARTAHQAGGEWVRPTDAGGEAGEHHRLLFGDVTSAGAVVFHDAWWVPDSKLGVHTDTMTVHHAEYYKGDGPPSDTDEPVPVSFLSVSGTYQIALSGPADALEVVAAILERGLSESGIGAKTAAGYGRASLEEHSPPPPPQTLEQRLASEHGPRRGWSAQAQAKWLLESGRESRAGASESEWKDSLHTHCRPGIEHLRTGGGDVGDELNQRLEKHLTAKPKSKKGKDFKKWKKERERLEKEVSKAGREANNRAAQQAKADAFLEWLDAAQAPL